MSEFFIIACHDRIYHLPTHKLAKPQEEKKLIFPWHLRSLFRGQAHKQNRTATGLLREEYKLDLK